MSGDFEKHFDNVIIGVISGQPVFLDGPDELKQLIGSSPWFEDRCIYDDISSFPRENGVYRVSLDYMFSQGYNEGYPADGESDESFTCSNAVKLNLLVLNGEVNS